MHTPHKPKMDNLSDLNVLPSLNRSVVVAHSHFFILTITSAHTPTHATSMVEVEANIMERKERSGSTENNAETTVRAVSAIIR